MNATDWGGLATIFIAAGVEWVEAFTIVLAVALTIGWARATGAAASALLVIAALIGLTGFGLNAIRADFNIIRGGIGIFLLLFGLRWYAKAIRRTAGRTRLHDEDAAFARTRDGIGGAEARVAWVVAFKGVLLEGLEVWLLVVALGQTVGYGEASAGAAAALLAVVAAGIAVHRPLAAVPENALKMFVGCALLSFGTFWGVGGLLGETATWPLGDATLPLLFVFYLAAGRLIATLVRQSLSGPRGARA